MTSFSRFLLVAVVLLAPIGCRKEGPAERAGARIDEMVDNLEKGRPLTYEPGPGERAGRAVDNTVDRVGESVERTGEKMQDEE